MHEAKLALAHAIIAMEMCDFPYWTAFGGKLRARLDKANRGAEYAVNFLPKVRLEVAVPADLAPQAVEAIATRAMPAIAPGVAPHPFEQ